MRVLTSIHHLATKVPTPMGVGRVKDCQYDSRECYNKIVKTASKSEKYEHNDFEMADFEEENTRETQRSIRPIRSTTNSVNMVYTIEFLDENEVIRDLN